MITWKLYEDYLKQGERFTEMKLRYSRAEKDAGTAVADIKAELDQLIKREIQGEDVSALKDKARKKLAEAEKAHQTAAEDRTKAYEFMREESAKDRITATDLVLDWNNVYRPMVQDEQLKPIVERMGAARTEYLNAILDFYQLRDDYRPFESEFSELVRNTGYFAHEIAEERQLPRLKNEDLDHVYRFRNLPNGIERKPIGGNK